MNKKELSKAARRFASVIDTLDFNAVTHQHKDTENKDKNATAQPTHEVRRGSAIVMLVDTEEESKTKAETINKLLEPFILEEFELLKSKMNERPIDVS